MMKMQILLSAVTAGFLTAACGMPSAGAASARELDVRVEDTLERFTERVTGGTDILKKAKGVLVFPRIWKGGFVIGGEYGEGALLVNGKTAEYYSIAGGSLGFQLGLQRRTMIMAFMNDQVLNEFMAGDGWEFGVDGSVAVITVGIDGRIDTISHNEPILVFMPDQKGLMYNLTLEGYKLTKIKK